MIVPKSKAAKSPKTTKKDKTTVVVTSTTGMPVAGKVKVTVKDTTKGKRDVKESKESKEDVKDNSKPKLNARAMRMRKALRPEVASTFRDQFMPLWVKFTGGTMYGLLGLPDKVGVPAINEIFASVYGEEDRIDASSPIYKNVSFPATSLLIYLRIK